MAKILVVEPDQGTAVPFLRGILTRSLQSAGLSFEHAYQLASRIRQELNERDSRDSSDEDEATRIEVTSQELRERVLAHLEPQYGGDIAQRYQTPAHSLPPILVQCPEGQVAPFSRGQLRRFLQSCGLGDDHTRDITTKIYQHLLDEGRSSITTRDLKGLTHRLLDQELGPDAARRYLARADFLNRGRPLLLLIGGTAACGKSTLSAELASRLDIVRTQSTDMLREVMRMMVPKRLMPILHTSSFNAWRALPGQADADEPSEALLLDGYRAQGEHVSVACEAVIQRALNERVSLILEGVHIQPSLLERIPRDSDAVVVMIMLGLLKPQQLRARIRGRGAQMPLRRAERYLDNFHHIWQVQSFLLSEADRAQVPIIPNDDTQRVVHEVLSLIIDKVARDYPDEVKQE